QRLLHEGLDNAVSRGSRLVRFGRVAIKRRGITERHAYRGFLTFRADEGVNQHAQPFERRSPDILEDAAQQFSRLPPFVALKPEQDRRLIWKILIQRSDTDSGLLGHPRRGETRRAFL